jgi:hypothetical protein
VRDDFREDISRLADLGGHVLDANIHGLFGIGRDRGSG